MAEDELWFEPVSLLARCSLNEGLLWVWAERVPISNIYREKNAFECLQEWECERLNIPPVPEGIRRAAQYQTAERIKDSKMYAMMSKDIRTHHLEKNLEEARAAKEWLPLAIAAMDVPAAELFLKLRSGQIETTGKLLPDGAEIIDFLEQDNSYGGSDFDHLEASVVPKEFWTMRGIDWVSNAVMSHGSCYCDVSMPVENLMRLFPGERTRIVGAEFVGDCVFIKEPAEGSCQPLRRKAPGRPPVFAWDAFHVEVADLIKSGRMPRKKEAAIQHMIGWFVSTQARQVPSRSAISEKLTPYYRRFFSDKNVNSIEPR